MKKGFTLAEVLITLTIIGVIAAMTMPSLNSNVMNRTLETGVSKYYSLIQQALQRYMTDNEISNFYEEDFDAEKFVKDYFKYEIMCSKSKDCFPQTYKAANSDKNFDITDIITVQAPAFILKDGTILQVRYGATVFDVNGAKGPNAVNRDLWVLQINANGSLSDMLEATTKAGVESNFKDCLNRGMQYGCFQHFLLNNFKFDY